MTNMQKAITQHLEAAKGQRCTVAGISETLGRDWRTIQDALFTMTNVELHNGIWHLRSASKKRTPKQQARFDAATRRAQQIARDRHVRLHNARIAKMEQEVIDNFIGDIATYVGAKA